MRLGFGARLLEVRAVNPSPVKVVPTLPLPQLSPTGDLIRINELAEQPEIAVGQ
jgi:hypothetical protein